MTVAKVDLVLPGTKVEYHGSLKHYHGEMEVHDFHFPFETLGDTDVIRYRLKYGKGWQDYLQNVRPESFTVVEVTEDGHA